MAQTQTGTGQPTGKPGRISRLPTGHELPNNVEAEQAVLGACLIEPDAIHGLDLRAEDFYIERHAMIWTAMDYLRAHGRPVDYLLVCERLEASKQLDTVNGGNGYLGALIGTTPTASNAAQYAEVIRQMAERRAFIRTSTELVGKAWDLGTELEDVRELSVRQLSASLRSLKGARPVGAVANELLAQIEVAMKHPNETYGIPTGFIDIDKQMRGLQPGTMTMVCGQPGVGKSVLCNQMAFNGALAKFGTAVYGLEMQSVDYLRRLVSAESRIRSTKMRSGTLTSDEYDRVMEQLGRISDLPMFISDDTQWTTTSLRADVARLVTRHNIKLVVVDYFDLLQDKHPDPNERGKRIAAGLKAIALDFGVALLVVHTLNKTGIRNNSLSIADMGGSIKIGHDPDIVLYLTEHIPHGGGDKDSNVRTLTFVKFREDDSNRYVHLLHGTVVEHGVYKSLPRFDNYTGNYGGFQ